tara:strand:- start:6177 stop:6410 length:234 start_codon:yes stop_codon:yes gene_type:complete
MNINQDYSSDDSIETAIDAMDHTMGWLFETFIEPKQGEIDEDQTMLLAVMGLTLKEIARRADAYDQMQNNSDQFSKN